MPASIGIAYSSGGGRQRLDRDRLLEVATTTTNKNQAKRDGKNRVYPPNDDPPSPPIGVVVEHAGPHRLPAMAKGA